MGWRRRVPQPLFSYTQFHIKLQHLVHPQLHFISHIPHTIRGEQLVAQFFRAIPEQVWLFKYGRVPMSMILGDWLWEVRASL